MTKKTLLLVLIAVLFTGIGVYFGAKRFQPAAPADTAVGALMQLSMNDAAGKPHKISEWQGKVLLVNFWATWCPPCVAEMPELEQLQTDRGSKGLQIVGIGIDSPTNIREFAEKHKITYPLLIGGLQGTEVSRSFGNEAGGLPFTVLIGADGSVKQTYMGRLDMEKVRADLDSL
jgi:thiol-disulfide isomerase/thioredoxin